jgi:protein-disulfide isomerase
MSSCVRTVFVAVTSLSVALLTTAVVAGCQMESEIVTAGGNVEARVKKLEAHNVKYAAALDYLQTVYPNYGRHVEYAEPPEPGRNDVLAVDITPNVKLGFAQGPSSGAPVTIVAAEDFACPWCERISGALDELQKEYGSKLRVVFKNMVVHPKVMNAHLAGCAAAKQGKFQKWKTTWWEKGFKPRKMDDGNIETIANEIGLDLGKFKSDKDGEECRAFVQQDMAELQKFGVNSTPTLFVNGTYSSGGRSKEELKQMIDDKLKVATTADYYDKVVMATGKQQFPPEEARPH